MKFSVIVVSSFLALSSSVFADYHIHERPQPVWTCKENVTDGYKALTISRDQFNQFSAVLVQKDQFVGNSVLATFASVKQVQGFRSSERYSTSYTNKGNSFSIMIFNDTPNKGSGTLSLQLDGRSLTLQMYCGTP